MDPVLYAFGEKVAALTPMVRPGLLERSQFKLMRTRAPSAPRAPMPGTFAITTNTKTSAINDTSSVMHEDLLPSTFKGLKKKAMIHPSMQHASEQMSPAKWRQTFKDAPASIIAGGIGYGIGRTLAEVIGEKTVGGMVAGAAKPSWAKALPVATALLSAGSAYAGSQLREGLRKRREAADAE